MNAQDLLILSVERMHRAGAVIPPVVIGECCKLLIQQMTVAAANDSDLLKVVGQAKGIFTDTASSEPKLTIGKAFAALNGLVLRCETLSKSEEKTVAAAAEKLLVALAFPWVLIYSSKAKECKRLQTIGNMIPGRLIAALASRLLPEMKQVATQLPALEDPTEKFEKLLKAMGEKSRPEPNFIASATRNAINIFESILPDESIKSEVDTTTRSKAAVGPAIVLVTLGARFSDELDFELYNVEAIQL